ncbi:MAG: hypothetical protein FWG14_02420 [Peptococcaceae bacterium]|nr:hypothetical protein [Peptococcaceae bacterium]
MGKNGDVAERKIDAKKIDALLRAVSEADKLGAAGDALLVEELDTVTGGVAIPDYQRFLQYVCERSAKERT